MRLRPYTEAGIKRCKCFRCGKKARYQWTICADGNQYRPICADCDISLNRMVLKWAGDPLWKTKIAKYSEKVRNLKRLMQS